MRRKRRTRQRAMVLEAVRSRHDHPSAWEIYTQIRAEDPKISLGTVYRNLNLLSDEGEVWHLRMYGQDRFDRKVEPHHHLYCAGCGRVTDVDMPYLAEIDRALAEETGYEIAGHRIVFEGLCPDCRRKKDS